MIIQHNLTSMMTNRQLGIANSAAGKSMERLSSGYKINRAADNASGLTISEKMRGQIRGLDRASTNMQEAVSLVKVADGAMSEIDGLLQRINELCVQGANDTNYGEDRVAIQTEIDQLLEEVQSITDKTEYNGISVLKGGTVAKGPIYGTAGSLSSILKGIANGGTAGNSTPLGSLSDTMIGQRYTTTITNITPTPSSLPITIGGISYDIGVVYNTNQHPQYAVSGGTGTVAIPDPANPGTTYTFDLLESYTPDTLSTAYIDFSSVNAGNINQLIGTSFNTTCCTCSNRYSINFVNTGSSINRVGTNYIYNVDISGLTSGQDVIKKIVNDLSDNGTHTDSYVDASGNTITTAKPQNHYTNFGEELDAGGNPTGRLVFYDDRNGQRPSLSSGQGLYEEGVYTIIAYNQYPVPDALNIQVGANTEQNVALRLANTTLEKLGLKGTILVDAYTSATSSISLIQAAMENVNAQRVYGGAMQNRFEHGIANADNSSENLQAAESQLRDANMATEMVRMAKYGILQQVGESMLAQAVDNPQKVLSLLQ